MSAAVATAKTSKAMAKKAEIDGDYQEDDICTQEKIMKGHYLP